MKRNITRIGALGAAVALTALGIAPAMAAEVASQASASAITIGIAGNAQDSGRVTATNDGENETVEGETNPPISVLTSQDVLNLGVLAQDATATVEGEDGVSAACAGVAGDGGAVAEVGDSDCITPGQPIGVDIANLDLSETIVIDPESALGALSEPIQTLLDPILDQVTPALTEALAPLASTGLNGTLGVVQARCAATPGQATGEANLADSQLTLTIGDQELVLATIPANPEPNTPLVTDLDEVLAQIVDGVQQSLRDSLDGALSAIGDPITEALEEQIINTLVAEVADGLQPIEDNILSIMLNKQTTTGDGQISVTALDLELLPAAAAFTDAPLLDLELANVTCGPNSTVEPAATPDPTEEPEAEPAPEDLPEIPTVVDAGTSGTSGGTGNPALVAGALLLMSAAALLGYRRLLPVGK